MPHSAERPNKLKTVGCGHMRTLLIHEGSFGGDKDKLQAVKNFREVRTST